VFRLLPLVTPDRSQQADATRDVELARTRAATADRQVERLTSLGKEGIGDQPLLESKQAEADMAKSDLVAAQARLSQLRGGGALTSDVSLALKAPRSGVLVRIHATGGQSVSAGAPLFEIAELDRLWVEVPVYVGDVERVDRSMAASLRSLGGGSAPKLLVAHPVSAPPIGDAATATARLFYEFDNAEQRFTPGQRVAVDLPIVGQTEPRLVAPYSAVVHDVLGGSWVYVAKSPTEFERVRVEVERVLGDRCVLTRGPKAGTPLVIEGTAEIFGTEFGAGK
jgi:cobalt-zinc-cadmium efflux system membrane fusion protein